MLTSRNQRFSLESRTIRYWLFLPSIVLMGYCEGHTFSKCHAAEPQSTQFKLKLSGTLRFKKGDVNQISVSHDGKQFLVGTGEGGAILLETGTRKIRSQLQGSQTVNSVCLSADGKLALTGTGDIEHGEAVLWNLKERKRIGKPFPHGGRVSGVCFSPDGVRAVTASWDGTAKVWDVTTGKLMGEPLRHGGPIQAVAISPDGEMIATASWDKTVRLWGLKSLKLIGAPLKHKGLVYSVQFSPDSKRIVTGGGDPVEPGGRGEIIVWDRTGRKIVSISEPRLVSVVAFSPNGQYILAGVGDEVKAWRAEKGEPLGVAFEQEGWIYTIAFTPEAKELLVGGAGDAIHFLRFEQAKRKE